MKFSITASLLCISQMLFSQTPGDIRAIFPEQTVIHANVPYAKDTLKKHLLDIYLPAKITRAVPLII